MTLYTVNNCSPSFLYEFSYELAGSLTKRMFLSTDHTKAFPRCDLSNASSMHAAARMTLGNRSN
jgi:hypothetical protein